MNLVETLLYFASIAIWGSTWLVIKFQLGVVHPAVSVGYRFLLAGTALALFARFVRREKFRLTPRLHAMIATQALFLFCLNYVTLYFAEQWLTSGIVAVLFSGMLIFNGIGSRFIFGERLPLKFWLGALAGVCGIALVFSGDLGGLEWEGKRTFAIALTIAGTLSASIGNLIASKTYREGVSVLAGTSLGMLYGAAFVLAACLACGLPFSFDRSPAYLGSMAYLTTFGSIVAFLSYLTLLKRIGPARASYTSILTPIVALTLSSFFEGFHFTAATVIGIALSLLGNTLVLRRNGAPKPVAVPDPLRKSA